MDGRFSWDAYYTHGENRLAEDLTNNQNYQKLFAAEDAVLTPGGTIACYAATQAATAAAYADCVPINAFGPTAVTAAAFNYTKQLSYFHQTNILDDMGASISGKVLDGWAGPITAALSAEMRFNDYAVTTNVPIANVNCTGLRLCNSASAALCPARAGAGYGEQQCVGNRRRSGNPAAEGPAAGAKPGCQHRRAATPTTAFPAPSRPGSLAWFTR